MKTAAFLIKECAAELCGSVETYLKSLQQVQGPLFIAAIYSPESLSCAFAFMHVGEFNFIFL